MVGGMGRGNGSSGVVTRWIGPGLGDAVEAITGIAETWDDVPLLVQPLIQTRGHDGDVDVLVAVRLVHVRETLRGSQQADRRDVLGAALEQDVDSSHERSSGRQHRVEYEYLSVVHVMWQAIGVDGRGQSLVVAHQTEESDLGGGHELDHAVEHAEACTQDRDDKRLGFAEFVTCGRGTGVRICSGWTVSDRVASYANKVTSSSASRRNVAEEVSSRRSRLIL
jgi:hypothetical protein